MRTHPKADSGWVLQFLFSSPHEAAVWLSATVAKNMCVFQEKELLSPQVLDLDGASVMKKP